MSDKAKLEARIAAVLQQAGGRPAQMFVMLDARKRSAEAWVRVVFDLDGPRSLDSQRITELEQALAVSRGEEDRLRRRRDRDRAEYLRELNDMDIVLTSFCTGHPVSKADLKRSDWARRWGLE